MKMNYGLDELGAILPQLLPILIPILLVQLIMMIVAIISLLKKELPFKYKVIWLIIIVCAALIGPVIYFAIGSKMLDDKSTNGDGRIR